MCPLSTHEPFNVNIEKLNIELTPLYTNFESNDRQQFIQSNFCNRLSLPLSHPPLICVSVLSSDLQYKYWRRGSLAFFRWAIKYLILTEANLRREQMSADKLIPSISLDEIVFGACLCSMNVMVMARESMINLKWSTKLIWKSKNRNQINRTSWDGQSKMSYLDDAIGQIHDNRFGRCEPRMNGWLYRLTVVPGVGDRLCFVRVVCAICGWFDQFVHVQFESTKFLQFRIEIDDRFSMGYR